MVILASQKSLCHGAQLFEIKILISSVFAYCEMFRWCLQNLSKSWNSLIHQKWININMRSRMKTNIMHRISSNNFISRHPYLEHFSQRNSCSVWIRITEMMLEVIKHCRWSASDTSDPWEFFGSKVNLSAVWPIRWKSVKFAVCIELL